MEKLSNPKETIQVLQKHQFQFKKKFGQNFLIDPHVLDKIVDAAQVTEEDFVLEIGPGIGTLTQYLCERARQVLAVEIDKNLIPVLRDTLSPYTNVEVLQGDILKQDIQHIADTYNGGNRIKVVANLPYYITIVGRYPWQYSIMPSLISLHLCRRIALYRVLMWAALW